MNLFGHLVGLLG